MNTMTPVCRLLDSVNPFPSFGDSPPPEEIVKIASGTERHGAATMGVLACALVAHVEVIGWSRATLWNRCFNYPLAITSLERCTR